MSALRPTRELAIPPRAIRTAAAFVAAAAIGCVTSVPPAHAQRSGDAGGVPEAKLIRTWTTDDAIKPARLRSMRWLGPDELIYYAISERMSDRLGPGEFNFMVGVWNVATGHRALVMPGRPVCVDPVARNVQVIVEQSLAKPLASGWSSLEGPWGKEGETLRAYTRYAREQGDPNSVSIQINDFTCERYGISKRPPEQSTYYDFPLRREHGFLRLPRGRTQAEQASMYRAGTPKVAKYFMVGREAPVDIEYREGEVQISLTSYVPFKNTYVLAGVNINAGEGYQFPLRVMRLLHADGTLQVIDLPVELVPNVNALQISANGFLWLRFSARANDPANGTYLQRERSSEVRLYSKDRLWVSPDGCRAFSHDITAVRVYELCGRG